MIDDNEPGLVLLDERLDLLDLPAPEKHSRPRLRERNNETHAHIKLDRIGKPDGLLQSILWGMELGKRRLVGLTLIGRCEPPTLRRLRYEHESASSARTTGKIIVGVDTAPTAPSFVLVRFVVGQVTDLEWKAADAPDAMP